MELETNYKMQLDRDELSDPEELKVKDFVLHLKRLEALILQRNNIAAVLNNQQGTQLDTYFKKVLNFAGHVCLRWFTKLLLLQ